MSRQHKEAIYLRQTLEDLYFDPDHYPTAKAIVKKYVKTVGADRAEYFLKRAITVDYASDGIRDEVRDWAYGHRLAWEFTAQELSDYGWFTHISATELDAIAWEFMTRKARVYS